MMKIKKIVFVFIILDVICFIVLALNGKYLWILNSQVALISSIIVTLGSYYGYKKNINKRVLLHQNYDDDYDELEKMDDPFDLYSSQVAEEEVPQEITKEDIKKEIQKNKQALKKDTFKNLYQSFGALSSLYRLGGYVVLILGFFFLKNNGNLHIISYLSGFLIVPLFALIVNLYSSRT